MIPNGVLSDWLSGLGFAQCGGTPPYSSILSARPNCQLHLEFSEQPTTLAGNNASDLSPNHDTSIPYNDVSVFQATPGVAGSNGYALSCISPSVYAETTPSASHYAGTAGSWVVTFLPTAWPAGSTQDVICCLFSSTPTIDRTLYITSDGKLNFSFQGTVLSSASGAAVLSLWHEAIATWDGTTVKLYLDQTLVASATITTTVLTGSWGVGIGGAAKALGISGTDGVSATLDCLAFFSSALVTGAAAGTTVYDIFLSGLTSGFGVSRSVSASNAITFSWVASVHDTKNYAVSATSTVTVTPASAVSGVGHTRALSASTNMTVGASGTSAKHSPTIYFASAATSVLLYASATKTVPISHSVSASTGVYVYGLATGNDNKINVSASTGITLSGVAAKPFTFGPKLVSASTSFTLSTPVTLVANRLWSVSAATGIALTGVASKSKFGSVFLSAATAVTLAGVASETKFGSVFLSASTGLVVSTSAKETKFGSVFLSAATSVTLSQFNSLSASGDKFVSAVTGFRVSTAGTFSRNAILSVAASTRVGLSVSGFENADLIVGAANRVTVAALSRQCRDINASATTSMSVSILPLGADNLKTGHSSSLMTFSVHAGLTLAGTEAANKLTFTDLAQAVVLIPWRRAALTLSPGGNLPHS